MGLMTQRQRKRGAERGSVLFEAAICAPIFFLVLFAVLEFGLAFRQYLTVVNSARTTTRTLSAWGNNGSADFEALKQFSDSMDGIKPSEIQYVVVFKAPGVRSDIETDPTLSACLVASQPGICNRYTYADLNRPRTDFTGTGSAPDAAWPPAGRNVSLTGPPDYVGVYVKTHYNAITAAFGKSYDFTDGVIYRMEPQSR